MISSSLLAALAEKYVCPHCQQELTPCHAPPIHVGDGLGWGSEVLFICLNDECSMFVNGWKYIEEKFGHSSSYRFMRLPDSKECYSMMVGSPDAFKGCAVDLEAIKQQDATYLKQQEAVAALDTCVQREDLAPVLALILDESVHIDTRRRACKLLPELKNLDCIEPLRAHSFRDSHLEQDVNMAIAEVLKSHFLRECPHCAELIKARATLCKHCQRPL
ncbi:MAG: zinc ribbon domain-containing protein [Desulfobulbaceae bacterium A2]|nr:MAG: zinc ribbon domain-containing protein [Desulfobulbaceae bacterium A2]